MNPEKPPIESPEEPEQETGEKSIASEPRLRYIYKSLELLRPETGPDGEPVRWSELNKKVKPFNNALELSDNIREVVLEYVAAKIPALKEKAPSISDLDDKKVLEALSNNWFEAIGEEVGGKRREVLLAVMTHVVKKIETTIYKETLRGADAEKLSSLGLKPGTRDLVIELLDTSLKADPLFIRFLALSQLTGKPPEETGPLAIVLPNEKNPRTWAGLFPHETQYISKKLNDIAAHNERWQEEPGAEVFREYLQTLSALYGEINPQKAEQIQVKANSLYENLLSLGFPIVLTSGSEAYYKEPYIDPELRVSLRTPEGEMEAEEYKKAKTALARRFDDLGVGQFSESAESREIVNVVAVGSYGVNLVFNAVAQEKPAILIYANEQARAYDKKFSELLEKMFANSAEEFSELSEDDKAEFLGKASRLNTVLHEVSHSIYPDDSPEASRIGGAQSEALTAIDEVKADIMYRPLIPQLLKDKAFEGNEEQWATILIGSALQVIQSTEDKKDPYYAAAAFSLNDVFEKGAAVFENGKIEVKDVGAFYRIQKELAEEVIALYADSKPTRQTAEQWIQSRCRPSKTLEAIDGFLKQESESLG